MKREVFEETQLTLGSYTYHGLILFESDIFENEEMHLFSCKDFIGDFVQSNEGTLKWIDIDMIFSLNLWEGDMIFLKLMLKESPFFKLQLIYEKDQLKQFDIIYPNNIK